MPARIGGYLILAELGRGGMARVYHALHEESGRQLAIKRLLTTGSAERRQHAAALFEREYHTLAQLSHPSVIEVYDYGVDDGVAYYTMELLDGGDLRNRGQIPWREACELLYDVCSSLALLHSRRLVHRDVTPRNVHCTRSGRAKLIDFGAMAPMGPGGKVVGTPAFVAPEVVHRSTLDGRADLYSLGVTLYYALTGYMPYPARELSAVMQAWLKPPAAPSQLVDDIPPALDALVMSMISLAPATRPRSAFEVMQRLAAIAGIDRAEPVSVSQAYLNTPQLIGRDRALSTFRDALRRAQSSRGSGLLIAAEPGIGRSRLLDAFVLEAKLAGAVALRAGASGAAGGSFALARTLVEQVIDALPEAALEAASDLQLLGSLFEQRTVVAIPGVSGIPRSARIALREIEAGAGAQIEAQAKLSAWFRRLGKRHAILVAIDDAERVDAHSMAVLAATVLRARHSRMLLVFTADRSAAANDALDVVARHCTAIELSPLDSAQTEALLTSVFGDVANIALLAHRVHTVAEGRPRECMALAQHLVDRGLITYEGGTWTLPERLPASALPMRGGEVFRARVDALHPRARRLAEAHALSTIGTFTRDEYRLFDREATSEQLEAWISELLGRQIVEEDGDGYRLSHSALRETLRSSLDAESSKQLHLRLAAFCTDAGRPAVHAAPHLLAADQPERALDRMAEVLSMPVDMREYEAYSRMPFAESARLFERLLVASERLPRREYERTELRRWLLAIAIIDEDRLHRWVAPTILAQLKRDSGLDIYRQLSDVTDPMQRLMQALQRAQERYDQTPEAERVYGIQDAIKHLVYYVVTSIAVGARSFDRELLASLPELLEPFAPLAPAVHAIWQNALATLESNQRKLEQARARWIALYEKLHGMTHEQLPHVALIRSAVAYAIGTMEVVMGLDSVGRWADVLDLDPLQRVSAMYLRKALYMQRGDFENAERVRRKAEVLAIQANNRQMFTQTMTIELNVHTLARDLTGVKQIVDRIEALGHTEPSWRAYSLLASAQLHRLRGDLPAARAACEQALELSTPGPSDPHLAVVGWPSIAAAYIETLTEQGCESEARAFGERALETCARLEIEAGAFDLMRAQGVAEGKCGEHTRAADRLEALIAAQRKLGAVGLYLGASYEARARVAIWAGDRSGVEHYARLTAIEYDYGRSSVLGSRYERLLQEARGAGIGELVPPGVPEASQIRTATASGRRAAIEIEVSAVLTKADGARSRAEAALAALCDAHGARGGHLYLMSAEGLALAASRGAGPADERLRSVVAEFCRQQQSAADMPTTIAPEGAPPAGPSTNMWTDSLGMPYEPLPIVCIADGASMLVGFAVLVPDHDRRRSPDAPHVVAVVGRCLLRAGDTRALAC